MRYCNYLILVLILIFPYQVIKSQEEGKFNNTSSCFVFAQSGFQLPFNDLKKEFGSNSNIGGGIFFKFKNNFLFGCDGYYLFGNNVKNKNSILSNIATSNGEIIDGNGIYAEIFYYERGFVITSKIGKLFYIGNSKHHAIMSTLGLGFIQHKIRIENTDNTAPQICGDYKKGYDNLKIGIAINEFVGYTYFSRSNLVNFFVGASITNAFTRSARDYNFNMMKKDNKRYFEQLIGVQAGWIINIQSRNQNLVYY